MTEKASAASSPFIAVGLLVLIVDQLSKLYVRRSIGYGDSVPLIRNAFHLTYIKNSGGAFGLLPQGQVFFLAAAIVIITAVVYYYAKRRPSSWLLQLALGLAVGGAAGNLIDRVAYGRVVDWLDFRVWPVFNLADSAIVIGLGLMALHLLRRENADQT